MLDSTAIKSLNADQTDLPMGGCELSTKANALRMIVVAIFILIDLIDCSDPSEM